MITALLLGTLYGLIIGIVPGVATSTTGDTFSSVLLGIPGASFAAVLMALFTYLGFELGTVELLQDKMFFNSMTFGFLTATILVSILCIAFLKPLINILEVNYVYYFVIIFAIIIWSRV